MNEDFLDILGVLLEEAADFIVVGAHALAVHGVPRATGDLDIWIRADLANAARVWRALLHFGAPVEAWGLSIDDLAKPSMVIQLGLPPRRIDLLTELSGIAFDDAWKTRVVHPVGRLSVPFLGRETLLLNKKASGRLKDLVDVETLERNG